MKNCEKSSQALANAEDLRYNEPITIPNSVLRIMERRFPMNTENSHLILIADDEADIRLVVSYEDQMRIFRVHGKSPFHNPQYGIWDGDGFIIPQILRICKSLGGFFTILHKKQKRTLPLET